MVDTCPADWLPKHFKQATSTLSDDFLKPSLKVDLGRVVTPFHYVSMRMEASEDAFQVAERELSQGGNVPQTQKDTNTTSATVASSQSFDHQTVSPAFPTAYKAALPQRQSQPSQALVREDIMKYCVQFPLVELSSLSAKFDTTTDLLTKLVSELCKEKVLIMDPTAPDTYLVGVYQGLSYYKAIQFVHGKLRRFITIISLSKCFSWSLLFSKSIIMRMHHENLVDMSKPPSFNGYPVLFDGTTNTPKIVVNEAKKQSNKREPPLITPEPHAHASSSRIPIVQLSQTSKKRRIMINAISTTPLPFL
ncbi:hypothetical protein ACHHYP_20208 [Achlya hypogyna]|uniref:Uncharacterized protein n=1 Tax=Achlya hypogyna TaxID=1202772 RepID=A0A1V9YY67_ACHHY|nr:hypothetical protein ACHHYP_20208 [Achlya hypogyna]